MILLAKKLSGIGMLLIISGLLFSRFLLSAGMLLLLVATLTGYSFRETLSRFLWHPDLLLLTSLFFLYLFTGFYAADKAYFLERMRVALLIKEGLPLLKKDLRSGLNTFGQALDWVTFKQKWRKSTPLTKACFPKEKCCYLITNLSSGLHFQDSLVWFGYLYFLLFGAAVSFPYI